MWFMGCLRWQAVGPSRQRGRWDVLCVCATVEGSTEERARIFQTEVTEAQRGRSTFIDLESQRRWADRIGLQGSFIGCDWCWMPHADDALLARPLLTMRSLSLPGDRVEGSGRGQILQWCAGFGVTWSRTAASDGARNTIRGLTRNLLRKGHRL
jgi:hypothetical protein